jgi:hypothetical protein
MNKWILVTDKSFSLTKNDLFRLKSNNLNKTETHTSMSTNTTTQCNSMETQADILKDTKSMYTQFDINDLYVPPPMEIVEETVEEIVEETIEPIETVESYIPIIKTIIGSGKSGYEGDYGLGLNAKLNKPYAVLVDSDKNIFVAERNNNVIRKVSNTGIITTYAGTGKSGYSGDCNCCTEADLSLPVCLAFDSKENLYIGDGLNYVIRKICKNDDMIETIVGTGKCNISDEGTIAKQSSIGGTSIAFDQNDNLYIADTKNNCIRMVFNGKMNSLIHALIGNLTDNDIGKIFTIIGNKTSIYSGDNNSAKIAGVVQPLDLTIDKMNNVYIVDHINNIIRKVSSTTGIIKRFVGKLNMIRNSTNVTTKDLNNLTVQSLSSVDGIVMSNERNKYSGDGGLAINANLNKPFSILSDSEENLYISDRDNHVIRKVSNGIITSIAGNGSKGYSGDDGPAIKAQLNEPHRLSMDVDNNIYISDSMNNVIRKIIINE